MREIAKKKKPVFVQANFNSGQGHVLHYITSFCVVIRLSTLYFWLAGKTETKQVVNRMSKWVEGGRQLKRPRIRAGGFYFSRGFAARSRALRARISELRRSCTRLDKTAMLRRLANFYSSKPLLRACVHVHDHPAFNPCFYLFFRLFIANDYGKRHTFSKRLQPEREAGGALADLSHNNVNNTSFWSIQGHFYYP